MLLENKNVITHGPAGQSVPRPPGRSPVWARVFLAMVPVCDHSG